jgi:outer membrane protein assembly factor BamE (lipoprotein component of BamABCDE complex)
MNSKRTHLTTLAALIIFALTVSAFGQSDGQVKDEKVKSENMAAAVEKKKEDKEVSLPFFTDYREVKIGMTANDVKGKLGKPKIEDKDGFFYIFSKEEQAQIGLDDQQQVRVIVIMYSDKNGKAPTYEAVFGPESKVMAQEGGNVYNLVRYPAQGFWIAYHRVGGDEPNVTITLQKM